MLQPPKHILRTIPAKPSVESLLTKCLSPAVFAADNRRNWHTRPVVHDRIADYDDIRGDLLLYTHDLRMPGRPVINGLVTVMRHRCCCHLPARFHHRLISHNIHHDTGFYGHRPLRISLATACPRHNIDIRDKPDIIRRSNALRYPYPVFVSIVSRACHAIMDIHTHYFASNLKRNFANGKGIRAAGVLEAYIE